MPAWKKKKHDTSIVHQWLYHVLFAEGSILLRHEIKMLDLMSDKKMTVDPARFNALVMEVRKMKSELAELKESRRSVFEELEYLDVVQAADFLGVSKRTFYRMLSESKIPYTTVRRQKRFLLKDLERAVRKNYVPADRLSSLK
jgi:excisionase family DNA binding protein